MDWMMFFIIFGIGSGTAFLSFAFIEMCKSITFKIVDKFVPGLLDSKKKLLIADTTLTFCLPVFVGMTCLVTVWDPESTDSSLAQDVKYGYFAGLVLCQICLTLDTAMDLFRCSNKEIDETKDEEKSVASISSKQIPDAKPIN